MFIKTTVVKILNGLGCVNQYNYYNGFGPMYVSKFLIQ